MATPLVNSRVAKSAGCEPEKWSLSESLFAIKVPVVPETVELRKGLKNRREPMASYHSRDGRVWVQWALPKTEFSVLWKKNPRVAGMGETHAA